MFKYYLSIMKVAILSTILILSISSCQPFFYHQPLYPFKPYYPVYSVPYIGMPLSEFLANSETAVLSKSWVGIQDRKGKFEIYEVWYRKPYSLKSFFFFNLKLYKVAGESPEGNL